MDIKSKSNNAKYIISAVILLVLITVSLGMYSSYPKIEKEAKKYEYNIFEKSEFLNDISNSNYGIYFDILKNKEKIKVEPWDTILNLDKKYDDYTQENMEENKREFNQKMIDDKKNLDEYFGNLEYYAVKTDTKLIEERNQGGIKVLLNDKMDGSVIEDINKKYSFYIVIDYDANGESNIKKIYGADRNVVTSEFRNSNPRRFDNLEMKAIKNMSYVYAVPRELKYSDSIVNYKNINENNSYREVALLFVGIALLLILMISLITPYKISKELIGFKKIVKMPIETISLIIFITLIFICNEPSYFIIKSTIKGDLINFSQIYVNTRINATLISAINIIYWVVGFLIIFIGVTIVKYIFKIGIKQYVMGNSLTYKILSGVFRVNKRLYGYIRNIDLKEKNTKKLVMILGINFLILSIMSCMWVLGIIVAIIYTAILFQVIRKNYNDVSNKYNKLFEATNKIAEGNLDVTIEENLGVFNDFKKEIESIQKGFKKAVKEEVKSQRMKTELITNVSHDLKTPLTTIITYVDLLKNENLTVEKRKEYLDTIDRKSQRLQELIEDLFEVSKATSGNINLNMVDVDVVDLMKQTLLELDDKIAEALLIVKTRYPEGKVTLQLDSQRMFRVFENLIINITKYAMQGSRVYIDIVSIEDKVEITLKNMTASEIDFDVNDIVERFIRGDKERNTEGSGLGLAIAKSFVELQGGKLNVNVDGDLFKVIVTF